MDLYYSTLFRCQTESQLDILFRLEDMLQACEMDFRTTWDYHFPLTELAYNSSYYSSFDTDHFEALYGSNYHSVICWEEVSESKTLWLELVEQTADKIK